MVTTDEQVRGIVRKMLKEKLTMDYWDSGDCGVIVQLKLDKEPIGSALRLGIDWKQDHGHGGGSYVNGLTLDEE